MARALMNIPTSGNIGDIKSSMLTLVQFQAINGTNWVLADGSSASGTAYATITGAANIPDLRGQFLRGKNNGRSDGQQDPGGDRALGNLQAQATAKNGLTASSSQASHYHSTLAYQDNGNGGAPYNPIHGAGASNAQWKSTDSATPAITTTISGDTETRPRNIAVNYFIKVN